mmetsp:Transcript_43469/g.70445  ORF Transcript_43469/g.70445 Transcript_43469/m.70445 type:complete len:417 (-) Transcript_43469:50-1300(-)
MPCCGCSSGGATEPEAGLLDLCLLEAADQKVKLSFRMPARVSAASAPSSWWLLSEREQEPEFTVSLLGGPHGDLFGPRKERVSGRRGHQTIYEVGGLQPDTEYTVYVSVEQRGETITETLEVRTAPATTAQFAGEDWGRSLPQSSGAVFFKPGDLGEKKGPYDMDKKAAQSQPYGSISSHTSSTSSVSSSAPLRPLFDAVHPGPSITPQRPPPPRSLAGEGDDVSTIAPSDIGTIDPGEPGGDFDERSPAFERTDENWDPHYEGAHRESSFQSTTQRGYSIGSASTPRGASSEAVDGLVTHEVQLDEDNNNISKTVACDLCSMMDCLKLGGRMRRSLEPEIRVASLGPTQQCVVYDPEPLPPAPAPAPAVVRSRRPVRPAFPGMPVDPASVGLGLLPQLNEMELRSVLDARACRRA